MYSLEVFNSMTYNHDNYYYEEAIFRSGSEYS